jgi:ubiquinone/menaquinone biosynthesis C-methylase UbiE
MEFKDYFSDQSKNYAESRPHYPDELFEYLVSLIPNKDTVWDVGTGNGQAAISLAKYFNKVIATDASKEQISNAFANEKVEYIVASAEDSGLESNSIDLVTCATCIHWFDFEKFYPEVQRILKPDGVIAAWCYVLLETDEDFGALVNDFALGPLKDYWPHERDYVWTMYKSLPFPFEEIKPPTIYGRMNWNMIQLVNYLNSWSSTKQYIKKHHSNPLEVLLPKLEKAWGNPSAIKEARWKLAFKVGRNS